MSLAFRPNVANTTCYTTTDRALEGLSAKLRELNYAPLIAAEIVDYARREGTLGDLVARGLIDDLDEFELELALVEGFDPIPLRSGAWDIPAGTWETEGPDDPDEPDVECQELDEIGISRR